MNAPKKTPDHPVPGDLVVRELQMSAVRARRNTPAFVVAVYPALTGGTAHQTLQAAVQLAHALAVHRGGGVQVWRKFPEPEGDYENLTHKLLPPDSAALHG